MSTWKSHQILIALVVVAVLSLLIGFVFGGFVSAPNESEAHPPTVTITSESSTYDDHIVHTFSPDTDESREYRISYQIWAEPGSTIETVDNRTEVLSSSDPLIVEIENRDRDTEYWIEIQIYDEFDRLIHDSRIGVGT